MTKNSLSIKLAQLKDFPDTTKHANFVLKEERCKSLYRINKKRKNQITQKHKEFECAYCHYSFNTKSQLEVHIPIKHGSLLTENIFQKFKSKINPSEAAPRTY